jgi:sensor histidine kinase regulating citrate/malate metabolism
MVNSICSAAAKKLVETLNGQISFENETGRGTAFIIELPLEDLGLLRWIIFSPLPYSM